MRFLLASSRALSLSGAVVVFGLVSALGCGGNNQPDPKVFPVEGALRYQVGKDGKGAPDASDLGGGTLELESSSKEIIKFAIASDGTFIRDDKLPAGKYRVRIVPPPPKPDADYDLDAKFKSFDSGLTVTITDETPQRPVILLTRTQRANRS